MYKSTSLLLHTIASMRRAPLRTWVQSGCCVLRPQSNHLPQPAANCLNHLPVRCASTFTDMSLDQLWAGCSGVSNAGKKKGRGKRGLSKKRVNIYVGKKFGYSKEKNYLYPGLNSRVLVGGTNVVKMLVADKDSKKEADYLLGLREQRGRFMRLKKFPLERGWSGAKLPGTSAGPPDPFQEYTFDDFDSRILEFKLVSHMTGNLGRKLNYSALCVIGNGKGVVGTALAKASMGMAAVRKAKNMAAQRLHYVNLKDNRTIWHSFHVKVGATNVFAAPKPEGHGIVCHRAIKTIAEAIGIKDIYCKVEGRSKNVQNVTAAFLNGLLSQETHQALADKTNYYVVELSELYNVPKVLAEPSDGKVKTKPLEHFDLVRHYMEGKTILRKGKKFKFYEKYPSYRKKKLLNFKRRNQQSVALERKAAAL